MSSTGGIIRIEHDRDRPYVTLSKSLTEDRRLSFTLRGILAYLLGKRDDWSTYMGEVEASGTEGREAIKAAFAEGRRYGYIQTIEHREKGKLSYEHIIYERPLAEPVPDVMTPDGRPSSILMRQQKAAERRAKAVDGNPLTVSRRRQTVDGQPSTETRRVISNEGVSNKKQNTTPKVLQPSSAPADSFAADAAGATPKVLDSKTQAQPEPQAGQTQGAASGEAGSTEQASPVQDQTQVQARGRSNKPTEVQDVLPASPPADGHCVMVDALRAAVYPGVAQAAPKLEARLGGAAKQLLAAGLRPDAPAGILALIKDKHTWRRSITPETVVEHSAEWQSAQANVPAPGAVRPAGRPLGCQPGERRADPSGAVWTVETVAYGQVVFEEVAAPRDVPVAVVAGWAVQA